MTSLIRTHLSLTAARGFTLLPLSLTTVPQAHNGLVLCHPRSGNEAYAYWIFATMIIRSGLEAVASFLSVSVLPLSLHLSPSDASSIHSLVLIPLHVYRSVLIHLSLLSFSIVGIKILGLVSGWVEEWLVIRPGAAWERYSPPPQKEQQTTTKAIHIVFLFLWCVKRTIIKLFLNIVLVSNVMFSSSLILSYFNQSLA